jgi:hypothetical protein
MTRRPESNQVVRGMMVCGLREDTYEQVLNICRGIRKRMSILDIKKGVKITASLPDGRLATLSWGFLETIGDEHILRWRVEVYNV